MAKREPTSKRLSNTDQRKALSEILAAPSAPAYLLFLAPDTTRRERMKKVYLERFSPKQGVDKRINLATLDSRKLIELDESFRSLSLFTQCRIFFLEGVDQADAETLACLTKLIEQLPTGVQLLLLGTKLPSNSKFLKFFENKGTAFQFDTPKGAELKRWVGKELQSHGIRNFPPQLVDTLVSIAELASAEKDNSVLDFLASNIEKTSLYLNSDTLSEEDLNYLYSKAVTVNEYELVETLTSKRPGKAQFQLLTLIQQGKSPFLLLYMLHRTFANYLSIASGIKAGGSLSEVRRELGMNEWVFGKNFSGAKAFSVRKLSKVLKEFVSADSKLKGRALDSNLMLGAFLDRITP